MQKNIIIQRESFNMSEEVEKLHAGNKAIGGIVAFTGWCRDENGTIAALEIEHYAGMAEKKISNIVDMAYARWNILGATVIHRFGRINIGEEIVLVIAASTHRQAAFDATNFIMDFLKTDAPFWKKEHPISGEACHWVMTNETDHQKKNRW